MSTIRRIIKLIPLMYGSYKLLLSVIERTRIGEKSTLEIFSSIHKKNSWKGKESVSGRGSDLHQTRNIIIALPGIFRDLKIRSLLDIPCGDFHWMSNVPMEGVDYTGADIVPGIIQQNSKAHSNTSRTFIVKNLIAEDLPAADLVFCRDCLVHLSFTDIQSAIRNLCRSGARYLLTTTFTERTENSNIVTGQWRPINLALPPFSFPPPLQVITEGCEEYGNEFADKSLALWTVESLQGITFVNGPDVP